MPKFNPMLAHNKEYNLKDVRYPVLCSYKMDGVRASVQEGKLVSRTLKPVANDYTRELFSHAALEGLDGELTVGDPTAEDLFNVTSSEVGSIKGTPDVTFRVFDFFQDAPFHCRIEVAGEKVARLKIVFAQHGMASKIEVIPHILVKNEEELLKFEAEARALGYEGVMIRSLRGPYKQGRSTFNEGYLLKRKQRQDSEAIVIGFKEQMRNENVARTNALGHTERSKCKAYMIPSGTLGAFLVRDVYTGVEFKIGGKDEKTNKEIWLNQEKYLDKTMVYSYFPVGVVRKPRHPEFKGWREAWDMPEAQ